MTGHGAPTPTTEREQKSALERLIEEQGRKAGWVAEQMGVSRHRLRRLMEGSAFTLAEAVDAGRILGVPVETFLPDEGEGS